VSLFDQTATSYQDLLQQPSPPPQQLLLREGMLHTYISAYCCPVCNRGILASESSCINWR
jgi:hypothetical protein